MIGIKGAAGAQKALKDIAAGTTKLSEETLDETGKMALQLAKSKTPVRTGRLAGGHNMRKLSSNSIELFNEVEYAHFVEYGSSAAEPRPHWRPALETAKREVAKLYVKGAQELVEKSAGRD